MVAVLGYTREQIAAAVKEMYSAVAADPGAGFHFPVGEPATRIAGYDEELLGAVPERALAAFAGVGCPFRAGVVAPGDVVLDIGAGSGVDAVIASRLVGPGGKVVGLDMTPAMLDGLRALVRSEGIANIEVVEGDAERIPLPDASVDVVTSNGVLNLVPDKRRAIAEIFRVLRPGGRVQIADIVIRLPVTPDCLADPKLWAECVVGATVDEDYLDMFRDAGFEEVEVLRSHDYFRHSPSPETREVAEGFGARAVELRMRRGRRLPAAARALRRVDPRRLGRQLHRRGLWGVVAFAAALLACYGTVVALAVLGAMGLAVAVDDTAWAAAIVALAAVAALAVLAGQRKHRRIGPGIAAVLGAAAIGYAMAVSYDLAIELAGFALIAAGVLWDQILRRRDASRLARRGQVASSARAPAR
ncbi:MAG TPA: MerC family mercury resistance protein [Alphaproteobacteria bacterium]